MSQKSKDNNNNVQQSLSQHDMDKLLQMISTVKYGSVSLIIQDGKVIQIDKNEKVRLV